MITVAVAGGTSPGLGRNILKALKHHSDRLRAVVLSRESSETPEWLLEMGVEVRKVDYQNDQSLIEALKDVHTVLCTLLATDGTWTSTQINLLNASLRAGCHRFAPAEFGCGPLAAPQVDVLRPQIAVIDACREAKSKYPFFEYAGFHLGLFMNYLGFGATSGGGEKEALGGLNETWRPIWDIENMKARIPLTKEGKVPRISLMELTDVGAFVAAACLLPPGSWTENMAMVGDTVALDEVVAIVEKIRGRKMEVEYQSWETVVEDERKEVIDFPNKMWRQLEVMNAEDMVGKGMVEPELNSLCPDVKPMSVEEYVEKFWS